MTRQDGKVILVRLLSTVAPAEAQRRLRYEFQGKEITFEEAGRIVAAAQADATKQAIMVDTDEAGFPDDTIFVFDSEEDLIEWAARTPLSERVAYLYDVLNKLRNSMAVLGGIAEGDLDRAEEFYKTLHGSTARTEYAYLYANANQNEPRFDVDQSYRYVGDSFNDEASSLALFYPVITLHDEKNFGRRNYRVFFRNRYPVVNDLRNHHFNNATSSVYVGRPPGAALAVAVHPSQEAPTPVYVINGYSLAYPRPVLTRTRTSRGRSGSEPE